MPFEIDPDIRRAWTLPAEVYRDAAIHRAQTERVLARSWHVVMEAERVRSHGSIAPGTLLEGSLDEPIVFTRDVDGALHALSNVCTHRGNLVADRACAAASLRCRYHGRRFGLDGRFAHMPEFEGAIDFPSAADDLPRVPFGSWGPLLFASLSPVASLAEELAPIDARIRPLVEGELELDQAASREYDVAANWALYCDNYLEGLHIPFVHPSLAKTIEFPSYRTELFPRGTLQIALAADGEPALDLPASHPDAGSRIAAYYVWLYPATMLNVYPWGLSVNAVRPLGPDRTRVAFLTFVRDASLLGKGAGGDLHAVELEDEAVVEAVQRGVRSRLYRRGRYSPARETGVHHFHRLLAADLAD